MYLDLVSCVHRHHDVVGHFEAADRAASVHQQSIVMDEDAIARLPSRRERCHNSGAHSIAHPLRGRLRIIEGTRPGKRDIVVGPRIGITQATDWPLRFYLKDSPFVSGTRVRA